MNVAALGLLVMATVVACGDDDSSSEVESAPIMSFDTASVQVVGRRDTVTIGVELAVSTDQKTMGLMERRRLDEARGMLFVYDSIQPPDAGFWMFRTRIPLDIAFLDATGIIRAIRTMAPCESTIAEGCPTYAPEVPYRHALEVNEGFFARRGIVAGDSVRLDAALARAGTATR